MSRNVHFLFLALFTLTVITSWKLYTPLPEGFSDYWALRRLHYGFTANVEIARWLHYLGIMPLGQAILMLMPTSPVRVPGVISDDLDIGNVPVRIRFPETLNASNSRPAFLFYHGGAYAMGDRYSHDRTLSDLALELNIIVVSVTYRLAPAAIWPAQLDDCLLVAKHLLQEGDKYGIDPTRIVLGGDSAGGQLAAAVSLKLRDEDAPIRPKAQFLIYPVCQFVDLFLPSHVQNPSGPVLTRELVLFSISNLLLGNGSIITDLQSGNHVSRDLMIDAQTRINHNFIPSDQQQYPYRGPKPLPKTNQETWNKIKHAMMSPYFNILIGDDLSNQPPTFIFTARYDVLRNDGYLFARALKGAGVDVTLYDHPLGIHGMLRFGRSLPEGKILIDKLVLFLKQHLFEE